MRQIRSQYSQNISFQDKVSLNSLGKSIEQLQHFEPFVGPSLSPPNKVGDFGIVDPAFYKLDNFLNREFQLDFLLLFESLPLFPVFKPLPEQYNLILVDVLLALRK